MRPKMSGRYLLERRGSWLAPVWTVYDRKAQILRLECRGWKGKARALKAIGQAEWVEQVYEAYEQGGR